MIRAFLILLASASFAAAQDYSANSQAKGWGLVGEEKALFEARVVDVLCELTGDCPDNCGAGVRQLGLVRTDDERLLMVLKNSQAAFSGAVVDLLPYCEQTVEVDGLFVNEEDWTGIPTKFYMVQRIKGEGASEFARANKFTKDWAAQFPEWKGKGPWFRRDARINKLIERDGYLGLGLEEDEKFIAEWF